MKHPPLVDNGLDAANEAGVPDGKLHGEADVVVELRRSDFVITGEDVKVLEPRGRLQGRLPDRGGGFEVHLGFGMSLPTARPSNEGVHIAMHQGRKRRRGHVTGDEGVRHRIDPSPFRAIGDEFVVVQQTIRCAELGALSVAGTTVGFDDRPGVTIPGALTGNTGLSIGVVIVSAVVAMTRGKTRGKTRDVDTANVAFHRRARVFGTVLLPRLLTASDDE
jgi:hypothetical protein